MRMFRYLLGFTLVVLILGTDYLPPSIGGEAQVRGQVASTVQQSSARLDSAAQYASSASTGATLTLTPNGGETIYIYTVEIDNCSNATGGTVGAVLSLTTTNITGSPAWTLGTGSTTAGALGGPGLCQPSLKIAYPTGLKAQSPGTAVTFVLPTFAANQTIRLNVGYRSAPVQ